MDTRAFLTPARATDPAQASFDHNLLYQFKIDNNGDAMEDKVIQVTFTGEGADQQVEVRGPMAPPVVGAMNNEVADVTPAVTGATQDQARLRRRHPGFRGPARRSVLHRSRGGVLHPARPPAGGRRAVERLRAARRIPRRRSSSATPASNYVAGFNVNSIVIELPSSLIENGAPGKLGIWGTISQ